MMCEAHTVYPMSVKGTRNIGCPLPEEYLDGERVEIEAEDSCEVSKGVVGDLVELRESVDRLR